MTPSWRPAREGKPETRFFVCSFFFMDPKSVFLIRDIFIQIRTTGLRFRIRIQLFSLVAFNISTKNSKFVCLIPVLTVGTFSSVFNGNKLFRSQKTAKNQGFSTIICLLIELSVRLKTGSRSGILHNVAQKSRAEYCC
jgi:hypothetical protein